MEAMHLSGLQRQGITLTRRFVEVTIFARGSLLLSASEAIPMRSGAVQQQFSGGQTGDEAERKRRREASRALLAQFEKAVQPVRRATACTSPWAATLTKAWTRGSLSAKLHSICPTSKGI